MRDFRDLRCKLPGNTGMASHRHLPGQDFIQGHKRRRNHITHARLITGHKLLLAAGRRASASNSRRMTLDDSSGGHQSHLPRHLDQTEVAEIQPTADVATRGHPNLTKRVSRLAASALQLVLSGWQAQFEIACCSQNEYTVAATKPNGLSFPKEAVMTGMGELVVHQSTARFAQGFIVMSVLMLECVFFSLCMHHV